MGTVWMHFLLLLCVTTTVTEAFFKEQFDVTDKPANSVGVAKRSLSLGAGRVLLKGDQIEVALLNDGAFSIGTVDGITHGAIDNNIPLTYGHPFAKTSFVMVKVNGTWFSPVGDCVLKNCVVSRKPDERSATAIYEISGIVTVEVTASIDSGAAGSEKNEKVMVGAKVTNKSTESVTVQVAYIVDPAIGNRNSDGVFWSPEGAAITTEQQIPFTSKIHLTEKSKGYRGVGCDIIYNEERSVIVANWDRLYQNGFAQLPAKPLSLYDATIVVAGSESPLAGGASLNDELQVSLTEGQFGSTVFARWDGPRAVTINNGTPFPSEFDNRIFLYQTGITKYSCSVGGSIPEELIPVHDTLFSVAVEPCGYYPFAMRVRENYGDEQVVQGYFTAVNSEGVTLDTVDYRMYIPTFPFSNEGLSIDVDTQFVANNSHHVRFSVTDLESGRSLYRLGKEHIIIKEGGRSVGDVTLAKDTTGGTSNVDIVFVLDVTGSMGGEIDEVKNNIIQFADNLAKQGIMYRLGMVTFLDAVENTYKFTNDVSAFQSIIAQQHAHDGGDGPENSLDALVAASEMSFRNDAKVVFIWITDAPYHATDAITQRNAKEVSDLLVNKGITVFSIGPKSGQNSNYLPIYDPTGGDFFDILGNFQDIQLDVAGLQGNKNYMLRFPVSGVSSRSVRFEVHQAGKGAIDTIIVGEGAGGLGKSLAVSDLIGSIKTIAGSLQFRSSPTLSGYLALYTLDGKRVLQQPITPIAGMHNILVPLKTLQTGSYIIRIATDKVAGSKSQLLQKKIMIIR